MEVLSAVGRASPEEDLAGVAPRREDVASRGESHDVDGLGVRGESLEVRHVGVPVGIFTEGPELHLLIGATGDEAAGGGVEVDGEHGRGLGRTRGALRLRVPQHLDGLDLHRRARARAICDGGCRQHTTLFQIFLADTSQTEMACHQCRSPSRPHSSPRVPTLSLKCCARRCEPLGRRCGGSFPCDSRTRAVRRLHHSLGTTLGSRVLPHLGRKPQICVASGIHPNAAEIRCTADGFAT